MIKVENIEVFNFEAAVRGMRNPFDSWHKSDSEYRKGVDGMSIDASMANNYQIGTNDLALMRRLFKASLSGNHAHRKYLRQIFVSMDITAPLFFWKEMDTYKVGTVANSCSTMHRIHSKEFTIDDFSHDCLEELEGDDYNYAWQDWNDRIKCLNYFRDKYNATKDKRYWRMMIEKLPSSYNQKRTLTMNYENAINIIIQRTGHRLTEWNDLVDILHKLPYLDEIIKEVK